MGTGLAYRNEAAGSNGEGIEGKFLTFWTDGQLFGVPIAEIMQIIPMQPITVIPGFPGYAKGVVDLRGSIIPVVDIRLRFGRRQVPYHDNTCIIIASVCDRLRGVVVDGVEEIVNEEDIRLCQAPEMAGASDAFLTGIATYGGKVILLLDIEKILRGDLPA